MRRRIFIKQMTPAEAGDTKTHEKYIRLPNNFDYQAFFQQDGVVNGSVIQVDFIAAYNGDQTEMVPLKFVYYANSNNEKRIPSLGAIFDKYNVVSSDIVYLESYTTNGETYFNISFRKENEVKLYTSPIMYEVDELDIKSTRVQASESPECQQIFYGCPGTGKSHMVEGIIKSAGEVVQREDTSESRNIKFHEYLRSQPYFSTGDTYHFALRNKGQKGLYNILKKEKWVDGDIESCFDITDIAVWHEIENKIKELHPFHNEYYEDITLHAIDYYIKFLSEKTDVKVNTSFRTTFHPDSDYASFVGCYKPIKITGENNESKISYEFVPQVFTNAYVCAWELYNSGSKDKVYLVIEEINRGNCAQIFGDLFQLLDRFEDGEKAGFSKYEIEPDADLHQYLVNLFGDHRCAKKLCLPPNMHILATMNTSDQSLFPMDSAFKRRWAWEYVRIDYKHKDTAKYRIHLDSKTYEWNEFLEAINTKIRRVTQSEDKQLGNFFIAHENITEKEFVNKVMFYLWSEVCKDNYLTKDNFFRNGNKENSEFSFTDLFGDDKIDLLHGFMKHIGVVAIEDKAVVTSDSNIEEQAAE